MSQEDLESKGPRPGRPRSQAARTAILRAAHQILLEDGLGRLTVEAVAEQARVGKPTIYRYWRNAQELAMAAFLADPAPAETIGDVEGAKSRLQAQMNRLLDTFDTVRGRQIALTMAAADPESELAKAFRTRIMLQCREEGRSILTDAQSNGEVHLAAGIETVLDLIYAPVFYRLLVGHKPLSRDFGREIVDLVWASISAKSSGKLS